MKKITHVITTIERGGAENQLVTLVRRQMKSGFVVSVIYLKGQPELEEEFNVVNAKIIKDVANQPILIQIYKLRKYFRNSNSIIHAHLPRAELLSAICKSENRLFFTRHNQERFFPKAPQSISTYLSRFVSARSSGCVAISEAVLNFLYSVKEISTTIPAKVIRYGYDPVIKRSLDPLVFKKILGLEKSFVLGTIARLSEQKNIPFLLNIFSEFKNQVPNAKLLVIGDGPLREILKLQAREMQIDNSVIWVGKVANVFDYLSVMNIFLLTSDYEGFGLVLLEAMDVGIPIVASDNSAISEVLRNVPNALAKTRNLQDFLSNIMVLLSFDESNYQISFLKRRLKEYDSKSMAAEISDFYSDNLK